MRITGGQYKNRKLIAPEGDHVRPTSDRMRQSLFNILHHASWIGDFELNGARALDLFCGTGALGLEALSHGAHHCTFIDQDITSVANNCDFLNKSDYKIIKSNALTLGQGTGDINLVFLDPPYRKNLIEPTLQNLIAKNWLVDNAIIIVECEKNLKLNVEGLNALDKRSQSQSDLHFFTIIVSK